LGTKLSAVFFLPVPILSIILSHSLSHSHFHPSHSRPFRPYSFDTDSSDRLYLCYFKTLIRSFLTLTLKLLCLCFLTLGFFFLASPYNFLAWNDFIGTSIYETQVAQGKAPVFYTQQFAETSPILYQLTKIFPYALGPGLEVLGILGSLTVLFIICQALNSLLRSYQKSKQPIRKMIVLLSSFLAYFLPNAFLFTKWTRFMTPIMPMFSVFASCFLFQLYPVLKSFSQKVQSAKGKAQNYSVKLKTFNFLVAVLSFALLALTLIPGLLFLTIYLKPDTRIEASDWIYQNIPESAYILSETANVVDIPIQTQSAKRKAQNYKVISFNFYDLDKDPQLLDELTDHLEKADYIFIPSQRIFSHVLRLSQKYPLTARYYQLLFSGQLGFERVAHFSRLPDEEAEETWSVFDHPAIRIYKKINPFSKEEYRILLETTKS